MANKLVDGNFLFSLIINLAMNIGWTIPAWALLAIHFIFDTPLWWFWAALGIYVLVEFLITFALAFIMRR